MRLGRRKNACKVSTRRRVSRQSCFSPIHKFCVYSTSKITAGTPFFGVKASQVRRVALLYRINRPAYPKQSPTGGLHFIYCLFSALHVQNTNMHSSIRKDYYSTVMSVSLLNPAVPIHSLLNAPPKRKPSSLYGVNKSFPWECGICNAILYSKSGATYHKTIKHTKSKPFPCIYCPRRFTKRQKLNQHLKNNHKDYVAPRSMRDAQMPTDGPSGLWLAEPAISMPSCR